jgi:CMP-N,N'-diacetyllegionaminic acid synthase
MMRPANLAQDNTPILKVLQNEIPKIEPKPDLVLLLQPTYFPIKTIRIKVALSYLQENPDYHSLISVEKVPDKYSPYAMILENKRMVFRKLIGWKEKIKSWFTGKKYVMSLSGFPISQRMTRRQDLPQCWLPTGEIYLFRSENLKKGSIYGDNVLLLETNNDGVNINTPEDFIKAQALVEQQNK